MEELLQVRVNDEQGLTVWEGEMSHAPRMAERIHIDGQGEFYVKTLVWRFPNLKAEEGISEPKLILTIARTMEAPTQLPPTPEDPDKPKPRVY
jgi:hypothetical protein